MFVFSTESVHAEILYVPSSTDQSTRVLEHEETNADPAWLQYGYNDNDDDWDNPESIFASVWWRICRDAEGDWLPETASDVPPCSGGWNFMKREGSGSPQIIQDSDEEERATWTRNFFRKRFQVPTGVTITKATLYAAGDNLFKLWINGRGVMAGQTNSLINTGVCGDEPTGGNAEGGIRMYDVTNLVVSGNNILAANLLNTEVCGSDHPFGLQYYLVVEYEDDVPPVTPTVTPTPFNFLPNCSNLTGPTTLYVGDTGNYSATITSPLGDLAGEIFRDQLYADNRTQLFFGRFAGITATLRAPWTPTASDVGIHTLYCRAWYDSVAECRPPRFVDRVPRYACAGPNYQLQVIVLPGPTVTPTIPPTVSPTTTPTLTPTPPPKVCGSLCSPANRIDPTCVSNFCNAVGVCADQDPIGCASIGTCICSFATPTPTPTVFLPIHPFCPM